MTRKKSVVHLTSVHPRFDTRIFFKECQSLALSGYKVSLIVADVFHNETKSGVVIIDVGKSQDRLDRIINVTRRVYSQALSLDADVYHVHDPELLPCALKLKRKGKIVVFDSHEDVSKQL